MADAVLDVRQLFRCSFPLRPFFSYIYRRSPKFRHFSWSKHSTSRPTQCRHAGDFSNIFARADSICVGHVEKETRSLFSRITDDDGQRIDSGLEGESRRFRHRAIIEFAFSADASRRDTRLISILASPSHHSPRLLFSSLVDGTMASR